MAHNDWVSNICLLQSNKQVVNMDVVLVVVLLMGKPVCSIAYRIQPIEHKKAPHQINGAGHHGLTTNYLELIILGCHLCSLLQG